MPLHIDNFVINLNTTRLVGPLQLFIDDGDILTIMGPSGCGKSTLLNAIGGHLQSVFSTQGHLRLNDQDILALPAYKRRVGVLFQDDLLFDHLNVWQNLALAIPKAISDDKKDRQSMAEQALSHAGLLSFAQSRPASLSGGQRARISVLRTLLSRPKLLLLDEPFSKLDKPLRRAFRDFVYREIASANIPAILVTHDEDDRPEASAMVTLSQS